MRLNDLLFKIVGLTLIAQIVILNSIKAQQWQHYTSGEEVNTVVAENEYLWVGSKGGLAKVNKLTNEAIFYNTLNSGIPDNEVLSLAIDANGVKWVGTTNGLATLDNSVWVTYDIPITVVVKWIVAITIDDDDVKWIVIGGGQLLRYDNETWTIYDTPNSALNFNTYMSSISIDSEGKKWINTVEDGILVFDDTNWTHYEDFNSGLPDNRSYALIIDDNNVKWIGTDNGLISYDGSVWQAYESSTEPVYYLTIDDEGTKWLGQESGIVTYDDVFWEEKDIPFPFGSFGNYVNSPLNQEPFIVQSLVFEENEVLWIGTKSGGLWKYDQEELTKIIAANAGLPARRISSIAIDHNGNKWMATRCGGVVKYNDTTWTVYNGLNAGLTSNCVPAIAIDHNGNKWVATTNGLLFFDDNSWITYGYADLSSHAIWSLYIEENGNVWAGLENGVGVFDGDSWTIYNASNSIMPNHQVRAIGIENGIKWFGTGEGLVKFDGSEWTLFDSSNSGLPNNIIRSLAIDEDGVKWIGTAGDGLVAFDGTNWIHYPEEPNGLPDRNVFAITIDENNVKWIGTFNGGLAKFDGSNWETYDLSNSSILSDNLLTITIDEFDNKWIGTLDGVVKMNECLDVPDVAISYESNLLTATLPNGNYQWIDCLTATLIEGANSQSYMPTVNGSYAVMLSDNVCSVTTECIEVDDITTVDEYSLEGEISLYPNPTSGIVNLDLGLFNGTKSTIFVRNIVGQLVSSQQSETVEDLIILLPEEKGLYWIEIHVANQIFVKRIMKK